MCSVTSWALSRVVDGLIIGCSRLAVEYKSQLEFRHMIHREMKTKQKKKHDCAPVTVIFRNFLRELVKRQQLCNLYD